MLTQVVVKLNRACNLRCSYCYYINERTPSYGAKMRWETLDLFLRKYAQYCRTHDFTGGVSLHGGEPLLMGKPYFKQLLSHEAFSTGALRPSIQTNGVLIDEDWVRLFSDHDVSVGISLDGPKSAHDSVRVSVGGKGSYDRVVRAIRLLQNAGRRAYVLCVVNPALDGQEVFTHITDDLRITEFDFLPPISSHAAQKHEPVDLEGTERFLVDAFQAWVRRADPNIRVRLFCELLWRYTLRRGGYAAIGLSDWTSMAVLETDGIFARLEEFAETERLDNRQRYLTSVDVHHNTIEEAVAALELRHAYIDCLHRPSKCEHCQMNDTCNGGSLASRFDERGSFDNPGVHCRSLYRLSALVKQLCDLLPAAASDLSLGAVSDAIGGPRAAVYP